MLLFVAMNETISYLPEQAQRSEILNRQYKYLVVDPYSVNVKTPESDSRGNRPDQFGEVRLSSYSAFVINTAYNLWLEGNIENIILFSDSSFGDKKLSTADLMKEFLMRKRKDGRNSVSEENIIVFDDPDLNQTATQLRKLKEEGLEDEELLYLSMDYHIDRINYHAKGYGVNVKVISAEETWNSLNHEFNLERFREVMPLEQAKRKEFPRKIEAFFDRKGRLPIILKKAGQGAVVDIEKEGERVPGQPRRLKHIIIEGNKQLERFDLE